MSGRDVEDGMGFAGLVGESADERAIEKHMRANRVLANKVAELEKELRLAMSFIGMCPHHVFKYPKEVVEFYERNVRYASKTVTGAA